MAAIKATLSEELEKKFRQAVALRYGARRGSLSQALQEAICLWLESQERDQLQAGSLDSTVPSKDELIRKYPDKFVLLADGQVVAAAPSIRQAVESAHRRFPRGKEYTLVHAVPKVQRRAQLGWRIRKRSK